LDDEAATAILKTCHRAMDPGVKLLLLDQVIPPGNDPNPGKFDDLNMLVMHAGRERNPEHFKTAIYFRCGGLDLYPHDSRRAHFQNTRDITPRG
jgi:hypothetical protein